MKSLWNKPRWLHESKYGRQLIFYNPSKPDKYHFRFYFLCCATSYACVRIRVHTSNACDLADGLKEDEEGIDVGDEDGPGDTKENNKIVSIVLDMCKSIFHSKRVVNMDNYYTSPDAARLLLKKGVYMRGTCRKNRRGFPQGVIYTKSEASKLRRGQNKMMVDCDQKLVVYGWVDGSPVQLLTTADGSVSSANVKRRVGNVETNVCAPLCLKRYNKMMQGVDRHDQLRAKFSLVGRHGFKKYYVKIILGLMDMAITNAYIHFKMANPEKCKHRKARNNFLNKLGDSFLKTNWDDFIASTDGRKADNVFQAVCMQNLLGETDQTIDLTAVEEDEDDQNDDYKGEKIVSAFR